MPGLQWPSWENIVHKGGNRFVLVVVAALLVALLPTVARAQEGPVRQIEVTRTGGEDRIGTAVEASRRFFDSSEYAVVATARDFPDALAAGPLARSLTAPLLLSAPGALPAAVVAELQRLGVQHVVIVGGPAAVSVEVEAALAGIVAQVTRVAGADRYATAVAVAGATGVPDGHVVLARGDAAGAGQGFADALVAGSLGMDGSTIPTLLVGRDFLPAVVQDALGQLRVETATIVGGDHAVSPGVAAEVAQLGIAVSRLAGDTRYTTAVATARSVLAGWDGPHSLLFATGATFPDSLVAGALTQRVRAPILLVPADNASGAVGPLPPALVALLGEICSDMDGAQVLGGPAAVSARRLAQIEAALECTAAPDPDDPDDPDPDDPDDPDPDDPDPDDPDPDDPDDPDPDDPDPDDPDLVDGPEEVDGPALAAPPTPNLGTTISVGDATRFLWDGPDPSQRSVTEPLEPGRASALRGRVIDATGEGLSGVEVSVPGRPEFGSTISRSDGGWDLAVAGGGGMTVHFDADGYLRSERTISVGWNEWRVVDDVVLLELDDASTTIDLADGGTHRANTVTDDDGTRFGALWIPAGTRADIVDTEGDILQPDVSTLTVRITEYTVGPLGPASMPGDLPAPVAYTYASELSADEVTSNPAAGGVDFDGPVSVYLADFLDMPVGTVVPWGSYDFTTSTWVPEPNGRTMEIVSVTDGVADVDTDGDGTADNTGLHVDERRAIVDVFGSEAPVRFWRMTIDHFTPTDPNFPVSIPEDAVGPPVPDGTGGPTDDPGTDAGFGTVEVENQTLREQIDLAGTSAQFVYSSDRVPGRLDSVDIHLSGADVPASLQSIDLIVDIAGRRFTRTYDPAPDLWTTFSWDGTDAYGRSLPGAQNAAIDVVYSYPAIYAGPPIDETIQRAWGLRPGPDGQLVSSRRHITRSVHSEVVLGHPDVSRLGLGGWTLSTNHAYDLTSRTVWHGDGTRRTASTVGNQIDEIGAVERAASAVVVAADGTTFVSDPDAGKVFRFVDGTRELFAGCSASCSGGTDPLQTPLHRPDGLAVAADGSVLIADSASGQVLRVDREGARIDVVAGGGTCASDGCGDGSAATSVALVEPTGVAVVAGARFVDTGAGPVGATFYIVEGGRIRQVNPDGRIATVAGTTSGQCVDAAPCGDGGYAVDATFGAPTDVAVDDAGNLFVADTDTRRVRMITPTGRISTVAGTGRPAAAIDCSDGGTPPYCPIVERSPEPGDGVAAAEADLAGLAGIDIAADGTVLLVEREATDRIRVEDDSGDISWAPFWWPAGGRVRAVAPDGVITTVAGTAPFGYSGLDVGSGGPSSQTTVPWPVDAAATPAGHVVVVESFQTAVATIASSPMAPATAPRLLEVNPPLAGYSGDEIVVPTLDAGSLDVFDASGRHLRTVHALTGETLRSFDYDGDGRLRSVVEATGGEAPHHEATTTVAHGTSEITVTGAFGQATTISLDGAGRPTAVTDPAGRSVALEHTATGLLTAVTGARTDLDSTYVFDYDANGRIVSAADPTGATTTYTRQRLADGHRVTARTPMGRTSVHRMRYLPSGTVERTVIGPDGSATSIHERPDGSTRIENPDGTVVEVTVEGDPRFGMSSPVTAEHTVEQPDGTVTVRRTERSVSGGIDSVDAVVEELSINAEDPFITRTEVLRNENDEAVAIATTSTSPEGRESVTTFDVLGRVVESQGAGTAGVTRHYDPRGRACAETSGSGAEARTVLIGYGDPAATGDPCASADGGSWPTRLVDAESNTIEFHRDGAGRVVEIVRWADDRAEAEHTVFDHDGNGNVVGVTAPTGAVHTQGHDARDQRTSYADPLAATFHWNHDPDRAVVSVERPDGETVAHDFDAAGRLSDRTVGEDRLALAYDGAGRVVNAAIVDGAAVDLTYTGSLLTAESTALPGIPLPGRALGYDDQLRLDTETVAGIVVETTYSDDGLVAGLDIDGASLDIDYRDQSLQLDTIAGLGVDESWQHNIFGEVTAHDARAGASPLFDEQLVRDGLGRVVQRTVTIDGSGSTWTYEYDLAGRLVEVTQDASVRTYTYDANGNRTSGPGAPAGDVSYDDADRIVSYGDVSYGHDAAGDLEWRTEAGEQTTFDYGPTGTLRSVRLPDGSTITYLHDGFDRPVAKLVDGDVVTTWTYRDGLNPVTETDHRGGAEVTTVFTYVGGTQTPTVATVDGEVHRIVSDHVGTPRLVVDSSGAVVQRIDVDEFGQRTCVDPAAGTAIDCDTTPLPYLGFAGGLHDPDTDLVRFGARDYDPNTGRFTTRDPIAFAGGQTNLYLYAAGDPANLSDPSGLGPGGGEGGGGAGGGGECPSDHRYASPSGDGGILTPANLVRTTGLANAGLIQHGITGKSVAVANAALGGIQIGTGYDQISQGEQMVGVTNVTAGTVKVGTGIRTAQAVMGGAAAAPLATVGMVTGVSLDLARDSIVAAANGEMTPIDVAAEYYGIKSPNRWFCD